MSSASDVELEWEAGADGELEDEQFLGGLLQGLGSALGLGESEFEDEAFGDLELEDEWSDPEFEDEQFLGGLLQGLGSALGLGEGEWESGDGELEFEDEDEGEPFLPALLPIAKIALPLISGLFSGRRKRRRPAREYEFEGFGDPELEDEQFLGGLLQGLGSALGLGEGELEFEDEGTAPPLMSEVLAAMAAKAPSEAEAEAFIGAATVAALTPREQRELEALVPQLLQASAILTRLLRRRRTTRRVVTVIPSVVKATSRPLTRAAVRGRPPTPSVVGRVLTRQTSKVLTQPAVASAAMRRNAVAVRRVAAAKAPARRRRKVPGR